MNTIAATEAIFDVSLEENDGGSAVHFPSKRYGPRRFRSFVTQEEAFIREDESLIDIFEFGLRESDSAVLPGMLPTIEIINARRKKERLKHVIEKFASAEFGLFFDESMRIGKNVLNSALALVDLLPNEKSLPKVAPDGEGGVLLAWQTTHGEHICIVDAEKIHLVIKAGSEDAEYLDDIPFKGKELPGAIVQMLSL